MGILTLKNVDSSYIKRNHGVIHPDGFGVILCTGGMGRISINDRIYTLETNVLLMFTPHSIINLEYGNDNIEGVIVEADVRSSMMLLSEISAEKRIALRHRPCVRISEKQASAVTRIMDLVQEKNNEADDDPTGLKYRMDLLLAQSLCYQIIYLYFTSEQMEWAQPKRGNMIFNKFISSVYMGCTSQRTVAYYAGQQNMSDGHFAAVVKEASGSSPMYWIELFTMTRIRKMLSDTTQSIKEIAEYMNFPDQSTFSRYFKLRERISPSGYRKRHAGHTAGYQSSE